jgi:hypothetical protein
VSGCRALRFLSEEMSRDIAAGPRRRMDSEIIHNGTRIDGMLGGAVILAGRGCQDYQDGIRYRATCSGSPHRTLRDSHAPPPVAGHGFRVRVLEVENYETAARAEAGTCYACDVHNEAAHRRNSMMPNVRQCLGSVHLPDSRPARSSL